MDKAKKPQLKKIRQLLKERSIRDKEGLFVAEGAKIVMDAIKKGRAVVSVFISGRVVGAPAAREITSLCEENKLAIWRSPAAEFEQLSSLNNSQGILAIIKKPEWNNISEGKFNVLCDGVQDPGNLGTIIRTSAAFGVSSVFLWGATADVYNPKVVRSSSGAVMDVPVTRVTSQELDGFKLRGCYLLASSSARPGAEPMLSVDIPEGPVILAFGSEGRGLSHDTTKRADKIFYIPIDPLAESLNVTAAAAIAMHHFKGKRGFNG